MFGSDGFQHAAPTPVPTGQSHARRASMPRSPSVPTPGGSSGSSLPPNPPPVLPMFGGHQFNMPGSNAGHPVPTATFVPPAPIPSPTVQPVHGWSAPPFDDWTGFAFESQNSIGLPHPMHAPPNGLEVSTWETALVVPPAPPLHAHSLPVLPSSMSRSVPPPPLEPLFQSPLSPPLVTSSSTSTANFLAPQSLTASPGVHSDICLPSHPPSRSDSGHSSQQPRVAGRKRTISEQEDDDVLELVRDDQPGHIDPSYMWAPRDKVMRSSQFGGPQEHAGGQVPRRGGDLNRPPSARQSFS